MASRKKKREFENYDDAMKRVEQLRAKGDTDSEDYEAAAEAATEFFLRDNKAARFNDEQGKRILYQSSSIRKWLTINELLKKQDKKQGG